MLWFVYIIYSDPSNLLLSAAKDHETIIQCATVTFPSFDNTGKSSFSESTNKNNIPVPYKSENIKQCEVNAAGDLAMGICGPWTRLQIINYVSERLWWPVLFREKWHHLWSFLAIKQNRAVWAGNNRQMSFSAHLIRFKACFKKQYIAQCCFSTAFQSLARALF